MTKNIYIYSDIFSNGKYIYTRPVVLISSLNVVYQRAKSTSVRIFQLHCVLLN
jgi:hypothetical protein